MALPAFNTKSPTIKRILKEAAELQAHPDPTLHAAPLEANLFEWHFTLQGPPSTPYSTGAYHGRIVLPPTYPLRPPSFRFLTPSGRFEPNREICLSISGHHEETWQPAWGIRTALWALRAFMEGDAKGQVGGMEMSEGERRRLANESRGWRCQGCGGRTNENILKEEGREAGEGNEIQAVVPEELKFGFKDEMGKDGESGKGREDVMEEASNASTRHESASAPAVRESQPEAPITTTTTPVSGSRGNPAVQLPQVQPLPPTPVTPSPSTGSPAWLDKAITGVAAALAVMVIKKVALS